MNTDRRQYSRYVVEGICGNVLNSNDLQVLNISISGAAVETVKRVELNREYTFRVHYKDNSFQLRGLIVWATLISKERHDKTIIPLYRAGVKFMHVSDEVADIIRHCMEDTEMKMREKQSARITYCF